MGFRPRQQEPLSPVTASVPPRCCRPGVQHLLQLCCILRCTWKNKDFWGYFLLSHRRDPATPAELSAAQFLEGEQLFPSSFPSLCR